MSSSGQILIWCNSIHSSGAGPWWNLYLYRFISRLKHTGCLASPCLNGTGVLDKKPLLDPTRDYILLLDKAIRSCEHVLSTPGSVNVFKGKIWPDLHLGSENPIPQLPQGFTWAEIALLGLGTILLVGRRRPQVAI